MPLRPIDAIFVHPKRRLYVVYYRGQLWQLPRMKLDAAAWQRRQPYLDNTELLYLSSRQFIQDSVLAAHLRTLNLPAVIRGSSLARFEQWWEVQGFEWLSQILKEGKSPLAVHQNTANIRRSKPDYIVTKANSKHSLTDNKPKIVHDIASIKPIVKPIVQSNNIIQDSLTKDSVLPADVFDSMLADLTDEVLNYSKFIE